MSVGPTNRRKDVRRMFPRFAVRIGGKVYQTENWSLGGIALADAGTLAATVEVGSEVRGHFGLDEKHLPCPFRATLVRIDRDTGLVAFRFLELRAESFTFLERLLRRAQPLPAAPPPPPAPDTAPAAEAAPRP